MRTSIHKFVIGRRQALAVVVYVSVVIALLGISVFLIADLRDFRDQAGSLVIAEIQKREDVFTGPMMKDAPDLTLVLRDFGFALPEWRSSLAEVVGRLANAA